MLLMLAAKAILIALIPLTFVYLARGSDRYRKLAWVMVFFTFDLIVFGADKAKVVKKAKERLAAMGVKGAVPARAS